LPWIQAFIWAFKPTDVIDIRRFPREEARVIEEEHARLSGVERTASEGRPSESRRPEDGNTRN
jgi:hypothetical protein